MMGLSENLRKLRETRGLSQKDVASGIGLSVHTYQNYEYGSQEPKLSSLIALADFYALTVDELTGREPYRARPETVKEETDMTTQTPKIELDPELTAKAEELYKGLGVDLSTAIRVFFVKSLYEDGFPFRVNYETPNGETIAAIYNTLNGDNLSREFHSVEELMAELNSDEEEPDADDSV